MRSAAFSPHSAKALLIAVACFVMVCGAQATGAGIQENALAERSTESSDQVRARVELDLEVLSSCVFHVNGTTGSLIIQSDVFADSPFPLSPEELRILNGGSGAVQGRKFPNSEYVISEVAVKKLRMKEIPVFEGLVWHRPDTWLTFFDSAPYSYRISDPYSHDRRPYRLFYISRARKECGWFAVASVGPDGRWGAGVLDYMDAPASRLIQLIDQSDDVVVFSNRPFRDIFQEHIASFRYLPLPFEYIPRADRAIGNAHVRLLILRWLVIDPALALPENDMRDPSTVGPHLGGTLLTTEDWMKSDSRFMSSAIPPGVFEGVRLYRVEDDRTVRREPMFSLWEGVLIYDGPDGQADFLPGGPTILRSEIETTSTLLRDGGHGFGGLDLALPVYRGVRMPGDRPGFSLKTAIEGILREHNRLTRQQAGRDVEPNQPEKPNGQ